LPKVVVVAGAVEAPVGAAVEAQAAVALWAEAAVLREVQARQLRTLETRERRAWAPMLVGRIRTPTLGLILMIPIPKIR
jgi:hypothetical protein